MKLFKKLLAAFVCVFAFIGLTSCSTIGKIQKAFENEGYTWKVQEVSEEAKNSGIDGIYSVSKVITRGIVIEFNAESAQEVYNDIKETGIFSDDFLGSIIDKIAGEPVVNGNCFILSIDPTTIDIFKNA